MRLGLRFIRMPKVNKREDISLRPPSKNHVAVFIQRRPTSIVMTKEVSDEFTVLWQQMQHFKNHELPDLGKRINTAPIQRMDYQALQCYMRLKEGGLESWRTFWTTIGCFSAASWSMRCFRTWHREREDRSDGQHLYRPAPLSNSWHLCQTERVYLDCRRMNVAGYYYVHRASIVLDPSKECDCCLGRLYCDTRPDNPGHADRALSSTTRSFGTISHRRFSGLVQIGCAW